MSMKDMLAIAGSTTRKLIKEADQHEVVMLGHAAGSLIHAEFLIDNDQSLDALVSVIRSDRIISDLKRRRAERRKQRETARRYRETLRMASSS